MNPLDRLVKRVKRFGLFKGASRLVLGKAMACAVPRYHKRIVNKNSVNQKKIVFSSYPSFSDNARVLYDYYLEHNPEHEFVWLMGLDAEKPEGDWKNTRFVRSESEYHKGLTLSAIKEISTAGIIYYTHTSPFKNFSERKGQLTVNLWHGCGYKDIHIERKSVSDRTTQFDYALVPGKLFIDTKSRFWNCGKDQILTIGYPRYDLLKRPDDKAEKLAETFRPHGEKLVMWMPTFRKTVNGNFPEENIDYDFDLPLLKNSDEMISLNKAAADNNIMLLIKRHPKQLEYSCEKMSFSNIRFLSNSTFVKAGVQLYSFLRYTDAVVSDYSSIAVDYLLLDKPMAFSLDDYEKYKDSRGFVFDDPLEYMPGHYLYTFDDFAAFLSDIAGGKDTFKPERERVMPLMHNSCADYCGRILTKVNELFGEKNE